MSAKGQSGPQLPASTSIETVLGWLGQTHRPAQTIAYDYNRPAKNVIYRQDLSWLPLLAKPDPRDALDLFYHNPNHEMQQNRHITVF